ncbi:MAG TPA: pilus assembly protein PilM [Candidatus Limnocylindria bacterium]|jgi:Tfp pilus assembly PilM family ATPase|nr:pilus assembly protein PilM [Candidatus Limnocylindria bacterium]
MADWIPKSFLPARRQRQARPPSTVTALDLDGLIVRVAQATDATTLKRVATGTLEVAADADRNDPAIMGAALGRTLSKLHIRASSVVMGIPRARVVLRTLIVPEMQKIPELTSIVHFQIAKDLPFRADEAIIDFKVGRRILPLADKPDSNAKATPADSAVTGPRLEVLVAVVKRDVVEYYQKLAEAAGLKLGALGLLPYGNARCVEACHVADGADAFALVLLRPEEVSIDIIGEQSLLFSRGAAVRLPAEASAAPTAYISSAVIEAIRSLHAYAGMADGHVVAKVVVAGATGSEAAVTEGLGSRLSVPCTQLEPGRMLKLDEESKTSAAGAMGAIGLAFGLGDPRGLPFDFLNPKRPAVQRNLQRIRILAAAAALAVVFIALMAVRTLLIGRRMTALEAAKAELASAEKKRPVYRQLINQTAVVEEWVKGGRDWLDHYAYLTSVLPPSDEVYISSFSVSGQGSIRLAVQARSGETLARLDRQLRAAGYEVKPLAITPGADRFGYDFRSSVELTVPDKMKIDLTKVKPPARPLDDISLDPKAWKRGGG